MSQSFTAINARRIAEKHKIENQELASIEASRGEEDGILASFARVAIREATEVTEATEEELAAAIAAENTPSFIKWCGNLADATPACMCRIIAARLMRYK